MNRNSIRLVAAGALLALAGCGVPADTSSKDALPQAEESSSSSPAAAKKPAAKPAAPKASSCDTAREAILTGTAADIKKAFTALQNDKAADATAREYARYYLGRDAGSKDMREADVGIIQMSCTM